MPCCLKVVQFITRFRPDRKFAKCHYHNWTEPPTFNKDLSDSDCLHFRDKFNFLLIYENVSPELKVLCTLFFKEMLLHYHRKKFSTSCPFQVFDYLHV